MISALASDEVFLVVQLLLVAWMISVSVMDHVSGRIPNWTTAPVYLGVGAFRLVSVLVGRGSRMALVFMLVAWAVAFLLWGLNFVGGGDAKFLMGLYALFPSMEFTAALALILLIMMVPVVLLELRRTSAGRVGRSLRARVLTGQVLPTQQELHERGRRYAWTFAVPAIVYTLVYWG